MKWPDKKIGLALGGGGVRGFSHIGVLNVLEQEGIEIDLIAGTSAGALIGGAYASGLSPREIQEKIDAYLHSPEFNDSQLKTVGLMLTSAQKSGFRKAQSFLLNGYYLMRAFFRPAILPADDFQSLINYFLPDLDISKTRIPFRAVTTDLITGKQIVFSEGSLRQAVLASCSVPGALEPVRQGEWLLADGGITSLVPVQAARAAGADIVIAVMIGRDLPLIDSMETVQEILSRAGEITANKLEAAELEEADVIIRPDVGDLHWMDFNRSGDLIRNGEKAARAALGQIYASLPLTRRMAHAAGRLVGRKAGKKSFLQAASLFLKDSSSFSPDNTAEGK